MTRTLTAYEAISVRLRSDALRDWLKANKRNSYKPEELPAGINPPTNEELSALEVFDFKKNRPDKYFLYMAPDHNRVTTWMGEPLSIEGTMIYGREWRGSFGDKRCSIRFQAITGDWYAGTAYVSAGTYARVRKLKR